MPPEKRRKSFSISVLSGSDSQALPPAFAGLHMEAALRNDRARIGRAAARGILRFLGPPPRVVEAQVSLPPHAGSHQSDQLTLDGEEPALAR